MRLAGIKHVGTADLRAAIAGQASPTLPIAHGGIWWNSGLFTRCMPWSREASYRLELKNNVLYWHGCDEGRLQNYTHEPEAGIFRRILATLVRHLPIESQL